MKLNVCLIKLLFFWLLKILVGLVISLYDNVVVIGVCNDIYELIINGWIL